MYQQQRLVFSGPANHARIAWFWGDSWHRAKHGFNLGMRGARLRRYVIKGDVW